jgi:hypothetical protein
MVGFGGQDEHAASPVCFFDPNRDGLWNQAGSSAILLVENGQPRGWPRGWFRLFVT